MATATMPTCLKEKHDSFDLASVNENLLLGPRVKGVDIALKPLSTRSQCRRVGVMMDMLEPFNVNVHLVSMAGEDLYPVMAYYDKDDPRVLVDYKYDKQTASNCEYRNSPRSSDEWSKYDVKFALAMASVLSDGLVYMKSVWPEGSRNRADARSKIYEIFMRQIGAHA